MPSLHRLALRCQANVYPKSLQHLVWSAAWLRAAEPDAATSLGIDLSALMVRAGESAFHVCETLYPEAKHWLVLVGPGNNGGDGYVVARRAVQTLGAHVTIWAMPHTKPLPVEATNAQRAWLDAGGLMQEVQSGMVPPGDVDLVVDGLLGTGISGAPRGLYAEVIESVNALSVPRVAIDIPSGLNAETGAADGSCFKADHTVSFIALKPGLLTGQARSYVGQLHYDTLGLSPWLAGRQGEAMCSRLTPEHLVTYFGQPRSRTAHKGSNGKVVLVGGVSGFGGAILMAAEASLAGGAGLTRVVTAEEHITALLTRCPEAMTVALRDAENPPSDVATVWEWASVIAVGPGLGVGPMGRHLMQSVLAHAVANPHKTVVFDADALNILADMKEKLPHLPNSIMTPHPGEAARLLRCSISDIEADRFAAARRLSEELLGGVVLLKGPGTIMYGPSSSSAASSSGDSASSSHCAIIDAGNAGMATGGMGDVLTGVIAAIAAQGITRSPFDAACAGALVHAVAADLVVAERGTRGLRATELIPRITECVNASAEPHTQSHLS